MESGDRQGLSCQGLVNKSKVIAFLRDRVGCCGTRTHPQNFNVGVACVLACFNNQAHINRLAFSPSRSLKGICHQITDLH
jgi:hypothetical protein